MFSNQNIFFTLIFVVLLQNIVFAQDTTLTITAEGNVGIGTHAPREKLEVNGNARIDGSIKSPMWNVTQLFSTASGGLPKQNSFTSGGGTLLIEDMSRTYWQHKIEKHLSTTDIVAALTKVVQAYKKMLLLP